MRSKRARRKPEQQLDRIDDRNRDEQRVDKSIKPLAYRHKLGPKEELSKQEQEKAKGKDLAQQSEI